MREDSLHGTGGSPKGTRENMIAIGVIAEGIRKGCGFFGPGG